MGSQIIIYQDINMHIKNVFEEGELDEGATIKEFLIVQKEGNRSRSLGAKHLANTLRHFCLDFKCLEDLADSVC
jgi:hypothetical protein